MQKGKCCRCGAISEYYCGVRQDWFCEEHKPVTKDAKDITLEELRSGKWTKLNRAGRRKIHREHKRK